MGSFLIFILSMNFIVSSTSMLRSPKTSGADMICQTLSFSGFLDLAKTLFNKSLSVTIPMGFLCFVTIKHPISCVFIISTAFVTGSSDSTVITSSTMMSSFFSILTHLIKSYHNSVLMGYEFAVQSTIKYR